MRVFETLVNMNLSRRNIYLFDFFIMFVLISTEEAYRYRAITNFADLSNFYGSVKTQRHHVPPLPESNDKKQLCKQMLNHFYFETRNVMWLDPDDEKVRTEIVENEASLSSILYKKLKMPRKYCPIWCCTNSSERSEKLEKSFSMWGQFYNDKPEEFKKCISWCLYKTTEYHYVNAPMNRSVVVGRENYSESVFLCPILRDGRIDVFYVSEDNYDMNEAISSEDITEYIPGKFIFAPTETTSSITISPLALAEDTARVTETQIEEFYLNRNLNQTPAEYEEDDPVCTLEEKHKLRLCSSILNSEALNDQVEYSSDENSVTYACAKNAISFRSENVVPDNLRQQWMMGCTGKSSNNGSNGTFYVSRGYRVNSAYLYETVDENVIFLYQYYVNVSVLHA